MSLIVLALSCALVLAVPPFLAELRVATAVAPLGAALLVVRAAWFVRQSPPPLWFRWATLMFSCVAALAIVGMGVWLLRLVWYPDSKFVVMGIAATTVMVGLAALMVVLGVHTWRRMRRP